MFLCSVCISFAPCFSFGPWLMFVEKPSWSHVLRKISELLRLFGVLKDMPFKPPKNQAGSLRAEYILPITVYPYFSAKQINILPDTQKRDGSNGHQQNSKRLRQWLSKCSVVGCGGCVAVNGWAFIAILCVFVTFCSLGRIVWVFLVFLILLILNYSWSSLLLIVWE